MPCRNAVADQLYYFGWCKATQYVVHCGAMNSAVTPQERK